MSTPTKDLDDAFLEAALEEVFHNAAPASKQPAKASRWRSLTVAAALLLGTGLVFAVQWLNKPDPNSTDPIKTLPKQDPAPPAGPIIDLRDAYHALELLKQVQTISLTVTHERKTDTAIWGEPWQDNNAFAIEQKPEAVAAICAQFAECLANSPPRQLATDTRNELSLHLPKGRLAFAFDPTVPHGLHVRGLGAWQPKGSLKTWLHEQHKATEAWARRSAHIVTATELREGAAWVTELTTVRPIEFAEEDMALLQRCTKLHTLDLTHSQVPPASLASLSTIPSLRVLVLDGWTSPTPPNHHNFSTKVNPSNRPFWLQMAQSLRTLHQLEVISMRGSNVDATFFGDVPNAKSPDESWPQLKLLDLANCQTLPYPLYAGACNRLPGAFVSLPKVHCSGELRLQHPPYDASSPHAERLLRAAVEFAKERGLAIVSVDVQEMNNRIRSAADGSRGSACTVGPESRVLRQGRVDYQWDIKIGQRVTLYPATDLARVILLHFYGGNWIAADARTESLVELFLR